MIEKLSNQTRLLVAVVISVAFFVAYDYFFLPKKVQDLNASATSANAAPAINTSAFANAPTN